MSISQTNPPVAAVGPVPDVKGALLLGRQTGDTQAADRLGALSTQAQAVGKLMPSVSSLGQNVDLRA